MIKYQYNQDTHVVHDIANNVILCKLCLDQEKFIFMAENPRNAVQKAKRRFSVLAKACKNSGCMN